MFRGKTDSGEWVYGDLLQPDVWDNVYSIYNFTRTGQGIGTVLLAILHSAAKEIYSRGH